MHFDGWTLAFQTLNFFLLMLVLHRFLFKPVTTIIDRRRDEIDKAEALVKAKSEAAEASRHEYETRLSELTAERAQRLAEADAQIAAAREKAVAARNLEAQAEAEAQRGELRKERARAAKELTGDAVDLAVAISTKILSELSSSAVAEAFLEQICEHLDALSPSELSALRGDLSPASSIQIASAPGLDETTRSRFRSRLTERLGPATTIDFVVDESLIAGVEVRLPHARLTHSFRQALAAAEKELTRDDLTH